MKHQRIEYCYVNFSRKWWWPLVARTVYVREGEVLQGKRYRWPVRLRLEANTTVSHCRFDRFLDGWPVFGFEGTLHP